MTDEQYQLIQRLSRCRYLPGSTEKRFARDMATKPKDYELTPKQLAFLARMQYRYRWQLGAPETPKPPELDATRRHSEQSRLEQWNEGKPRTE